MHVPLRNALGKCVVTGGGVDVQTDGLGERLQRMAGKDALPDLRAFDRSDPLHVDQVARRLLARLWGENDGKAFELLVELTEPLLMRVALDITREIGLAFPPEELLGWYMGRVLVDLRRPPPDVPHFLQTAERALEQEAQRLLEKFRDSIPLRDGELRHPALSLGADDLPPRPGMARIQAAMGRRFLSMMTVCFHHLDLADRRILLAREADQLSYAQIAQRLDVPPDEVLPRLMAARNRLAALAASVFTTHGATWKEDKE